ncbi:glycosyltransferase family 2 protein [Pseudanabaena sp. FACHB-2040]|uniref:glycosyltransferase family 2 protein n=1 Tax=Pseudanabaena sp. FACHB-2040 TaxID=2692859 RepID=UPI0016894616|nr:glycosyltransferase family 2 protein [Pseudanabaena sp. FACHB-2040]MBD2260596.1 glycosyltransferase family 2 protein [Pseudanabaena sp. FACHB-2040]
MQVPVALLIFNRPETTQVVFDAIRQAKPSKLLVIADGPRLDKPNDLERCQQARDIVQKVDWDCELLTSFSDVNLGCKKRVYTGLSWVFSIVDRAIILEDDCCPHPSFFPYCAELLEYYRDDTRITSICGENAQFGREVTEYSYYFSRYFHGWGWATWRRAWQNYDIEMKLWPKAKNSKEFQSLFTDFWVERHWKNLFQDVYDGNISTCWDYQWIFNSFTQGGLSIIPQVNLISNIGFGANATHTYDQSSMFANVGTHPIEFPIHHNPLVIPNIEADCYEELTKFHVPDSMRRLKISLKEALKGNFRSLKRSFS